MSSETFTLVIEDGDGARVAEFPFEVTFEAHSIDGDLTLTPGNES